MKKTLHLSLKMFYMVNHFVLLLVIVFAFGCSKQNNNPTPAPTPTATPTPIVAVPPINTNSTTAKEIMVDMGAGFNLGNTFDLNLTNSATFTSVKPIVDL